MALHGLCTLGLTFNVQGAPAHVITAVPLEPAARIGPVGPTLIPPVRERLGEWTPKKFSRWS